MLAAGRCFPELPWQARSLTLLGLGTARHDMENFQSSCRWFSITLSQRSQRHVAFSQNSIALPRFAILFGTIRIKLLQTVSQNPKNLVFFHLIYRDVAKKPSHIIFFTYLPL
jgi:hypothetical protein